MANQNLGQLAGSFAEAFSRTVGQKQDRKHRDEIAKQQAKLVEMRLKAGEIQLNAQTTLADLMTGTVEEFVPAEPQITPGGREIPQFTSASQQPMDLASILSDPEGQLAAVQSGALKIGDLLDFQTAQAELEARPDISELFSGQADESGNPMFVPGSITLDPVKGPIQTFVRNPEFNTRQQEAFSRQSLSQLTSEAIEIMDIESELAGSLLESGFPFGGQARTGQAALATVGGALGFDTEEQKQAIAKRDRVEKLYGQILGIRMQRMSASGETITNDKLAFLQQISPDTKKSPDANAKLLADFLQEELNTADIEGTTISADERRKALDFIRKARSGEFLQTQEPVVDAPGAIEGATEAFGRFKDFTIEQIQKVDVPSLPEADIPALRAKLDQLKQQGAAAVESVQSAVEPSSNQKLLAKMALLKTTLAAASAIEKAKAGIAKAADFAELTIEEIQQIDKDDIKQWTKEQKDAFDKRRKELGL